MIALLPAKFRDSLGAIAVKSFVSCVACLLLCGSVIALAGCSQTKTQTRQTQVAKNDRGPAAISTSEQPTVVRPTAEHPPVPEEVHQSSQELQQSDRQLQQSDEREPAAPLPAKDVSGPQTQPYTVYKPTIEETNSSAAPKVWLSAEHSAMCRVRVGDELPTRELSKLDGGRVDLASFLGSEATVVLFWHPDRWMSETALQDLEREVASQYDVQKVSVVGIAVETPRADVKRESQDMSFPQLLDEDGKLFAKIGMVMLPRIYVLDPAAHIVWFDIEYSEATRRELHSTLAALTGTPIQ